MFKYKNISNNTIVLLVKGEIARIPKGHILESVDPLNYPFLANVDEPPVKKVEEKPKEVRRGRKIRET